MKRLLVVFAFASAACAAGGAHRMETTAPAAGQRPRPYPVFETLRFQRAVERGTRTTNQVWTPP